MDGRSERKALEGRREEAGGPPDGPKRPPAILRANNGDEKGGRTEERDRTKQEEGERKARQVWEEIGEGRWAERQEESKEAEPQEAGEKGEDNRKAQRKGVRKSNKSTKKGCLDISCVRFGCEGKHDDDEEEGEEEKPEDWESDSDEIKGNSENRRKTDIRLDDLIKEDKTGTYFASNITYASKKAKSYLYKLEDDVIAASETH